MGQILYYLGVRLKSNRNVYHHEYEIIPLEELKRPRIDVVVNMCGFFRDMFPNVLDNLNDIIQKVSSLDEMDDMNYVKRNTTKTYNSLKDMGYKEKDAKELSFARIFGPREGEYGTEVTNIVQNQNWKDENELADNYIGSLKYAYTKSLRGKEAEKVLDLNLAAVDIVSQVRFDNDYEITDLDHYYEFYGGLSKSVEKNKGQKAKMYVSDSTGAKVYTDSIDKCIAKGVNTRLLNPKWIDAMAEHNYNGVQKIADRFENILGLAATTNSVDNIIFERMHSTYVEDEILRNKLIEKNKFAYLNMMEKMLECNLRGYWSTSEDKLEQIKKIYMELEE